MVELKERAEIDKKAPPPSLYLRVYGRPRLVRALRIFDKCTVVLVALGYLAAVVTLAFCSVTDLIRLLISTAVPFLAVSVFRHLFNAPRPCELYDLSGLTDTSVMKKGRSFPSRHVTSAHLIGSSLCFLNPVAGIIILILGIGVGACRILLAKHFIRDVVTGAILGSLLGCLGMLIVNIS